MRWIALVLAVFGCGAGPEPEACRAPVAVERESTCAPDIDTNAIGCTLISGEVDGCTVRQWAACGDGVTKATVYDNAGGSVVFEKVETSCRVVFWLVPHE